MNKNTKSHFISQLVVGEEMDCQIMRVLERLASCLFILELWFKTFGWYLSIESFRTFAVVVDRVVVSYPLDVAQLVIAQFAVCRGRPPVSRSAGSTLIDTDRSIPSASPYPKIAVSCYKGCATPINLFQAFGMKLVCKRDNPEYKVTWPLSYKKKEKKGKSLAAYSYVMCIFCNVQVQQNQHLDQIGRCISIFASQLEASLPKGLRYVR